MQELISDIGAFLASVFWHWQAWAGGTGVGGAVVVGIAIFEHLTGSNMGKRMYISIIVCAFLFGAFFMAWRDEHRKSLDLKAQLKAKLDSPEFKLLDGTSVWWGPRDRDHRLMMIVAVAISNPQRPS
jgi:hypothetical protein